MPCGEVLHRGPVPLPRPQDAHGARAAVARRLQPRACRASLPTNLLAPTSRRPQTSGRAAEFSDGASRLCGRFHCRSSPLASVRSGTFRLYSSSRGYRGVPRAGGIESWVLSGLHAGLRGTLPRWRRRAGAPWLRRWRGPGNRFNSLPRSLGARPPRRRGGTPRNGARAAHAGPWRRPRPRVL